MKEPESDFEFEVTDLHTGAAMSHPLDENASTRVDERGNGETLPSPPNAGRHIRVMVVASVVLLAMVLVALVDPALRSSLSLAFHPAPAPLPTLAADANLVFLESGAPWGAYSLDGLETFPLTQPGAHLSAVWIRLTLGRHTLQVTQPPFPSLKCSISTPAARSDTCPVVSPQNLHDPYFGNQSGLLPTSRIIDLGARFDRLPHASAAALAEVTRGALALTSESAGIMPGDHYLRDDGRIAVALTPLQITLQLELPPPNDAAPSDSPRCQSFCDELASGQDSFMSGGMWSLVTMPKGSWRVTTRDGKVIANHAPLWPHDALYGAIPQNTENLRTPLRVDWDGAWHILQQLDFSFGDPSLRDVAQAMASALLNASPTVDSSSMNTLNGQGLNANQGCVITLTLRDPSATTPLYLYYHFGALLAANDAAHRAFPGIPVASANEHALARAILGLT